MNPVTARPQHFELYGAPGTLPEVLAETNEIIASPWKPHKFTPTAMAARGFVRLRAASWDLACELCARATSLHDLRLAFPTATVRGWDDVEPILARLPWRELLPNEHLELRAEAGSGVLAHAAKLQGLGEQFFAARGFALGNADPFTRLELESGADHLRVRVSLGNDALHKRGWRAQTSTLATLREDLAASVLRRLATWEPKAYQATRITVPFAGSGTLGMEAWQALFGLPPAIWGAARPWQRLAGINDSSLNWWWRRVVRAATDARLPPITFIENNAKQLAELKANCSNASTLLEEEGIAVPKLEVQLADVFALPAARVAEPGQITLLPLHPPYGLRLSRNADIEGLYRRLGSAVRDWAAAATRDNGALIGFCLCPSLETWRGFQSAADGLQLETSHVTQGGLDVRVCCFRAG